MKQACLLGGALSLGLGALATGAIVAPSPLQAQGDPVWLKSYAEAQAAARQSGKPIFLVFR